ncbi:MAG: ketoacyl-ACP synthase III [Lachnospiraceae bacterium]|nr:ketoacyl-ACP synthase III [Lachnospiraceae bacterium]
MTIRISGTGSALPDRILTNRELEERVDTSDEWIRERTGIVTRHIADKETVASLAAEACRRALADAGKKAEEVELILLASCSSEMMLPCGACRVQAEIAAQNAAAFDINAACSGFVFALQTANAYIASGMYKNALVVGAEVLSGIVDPSDRNTCILFGDGAGAVFCEMSTGEGEGMIAALQGSMGDRGGVLCCRAGHRRDADYAEYPKKDAFVHMDGAEVYSFAVRTVPACIEKLLDMAGMGAEEIDLFLLHQANIRIINSVAKRLKIPADRFPSDLERVGNTSSAAIPLLLDELNKCGKIVRGCKLVLAAFGAGLTYGACVLQW